MVTAILTSVRSNGILSVNNQAASVLHQLQLLDLLIDQSLLDQRLLHVDVQHPNVTHFISDVELLECVVPENGSVDHFVRIFNAKELASIGSVESLELLVE